MGSTRAGNRRGRGGSGVAASGMCPSPVNKPEVGSSPTQPAPGKYTSAQACKSVKSCRARAGRRAALCRASTESDSRKRSAPPGPGYASPAPATRPNHGKPVPRVSVSSQVCTPGSIRMTYCTSCTSAVQVDQKIDGAAGRGRHPARATRASRGPSGERSQIRPQFLAQPTGIRERKLHGVGVEKEVERIDDRQLGHQIDFQLERGRRFAGTPAATGSCRADPAAS